MGSLFGGSSQAFSVQAPIKDVEDSRSSVDPNESAKRAAAAAKRKSMQLSASRKSLRTNLSKPGSRERRTTAIK